VKKSNNKRLFDYLNSIMQRYVETGLQPFKFVADRLKFVANPAKPL